MAQTLIASVQIKRGTTTNRVAMIPLDGEFVFDTDLQELFIGDGITAGGNRVANSSIDDAWNPTISYPAGAIVSHSNIIWLSTATAPPSGGEPGVAEVWINVSSAGVSNFVDLTDTPTDYGTIGSFLVTDSNGITYVSSLDAGTF